jgi:hypothetical protein
MIFEFRKARLVKQNPKQHKSGNNVMNLISFVVCILLYKGALATFGVDVSLMDCESGISLKDWQCLTDNGYDFAIIEVWDGSYNFDSNIGYCKNDCNY